MGIEIILVTDSMALWSRRLTITAHEPWKTSKYLWFLKHKATRGVATFPGWNANSPS